MDAITTQNATSEEELSFERFRSEVLNDYRIACISRETSLLGRKEVLTGKAKFGIFGDGKEVAQVALAKFFRPGDFRSGYYRDQTFMFATGMCTVEQYFSQLFADPDIQHDTMSAGRQMNAHFSTPFVDAEGNWLPLAKRKNSSSDISPTAGQMPRALGLALASKLFRKSPFSGAQEHFTDNGNEICFCTIGDASTSEGHFWEVMNAAGVHQVPLAVFVWDDGYGISVPKKFQTTKSSISTALSGLKYDTDSNGIDIYRLKGWDYAGLCEVFEPALQKMRETHIPALFHIEEVTQPQGHSTSGSHERYKQSDRLEWEKEWDCLRQMRKWLLTNSLAEEAELDALEADARQYVKTCKQNAWDKFTEPIRQMTDRAAALLSAAAEKHTDTETAAKLVALQRETLQAVQPLRRDILQCLAAAVPLTAGQSGGAEIAGYYRELQAQHYGLYGRYLYNEGPRSALRVETEPVCYTDDSPVLNGYEVLNRYFDELFGSNDRVVAFGEDVGHIGDVNQGFTGLQEKYGVNRIYDTGIRETSIMGQGIGLALRGYRPIAEIQYLDYLLFGLQTLSDDVATNHYRSYGKQSCPIIVRTRGHRLEGIWHSGSPMGMIINALRGMYVCVPRNMVQAVGMYNTLLASNDPGLIIECLNGYRLKEKLPANLTTFRLPLGVPEVVRQGSDLTVVTYGSTLRIVLEAAEILEKIGISCEVVDVQTLLPFDTGHRIVESLKKTNRIVFVDEDVPGGATSYMFNHVMEQQGGYRWLDVSPRTVSAQPHRPAYSSDGDYFSKPNREDIVQVISDMMAE
jgi:pyruvate/2-oxoglutarate/acetoin dehydrogenase E1 component/TPP-dependent pyruvate/acetoin dehydrogenase alpha subunit